MKIKVCGMRDSENIIRLAELKPDYIGLIFYPLSSRCAENPDVQILENLSHSIKLVGVFVDAAIQEIVKKVMEFGLDAVQLHGSESVAYCDELRKSLTETLNGRQVEIFKAFGLSAEFSFEILDDYMPVCDFFLFDTKSPSHGGSGMAFDWDLLAKYSGPKPYFLSGGLSPENISGISKFADKYLYGVDLNSKFEIKPGLKNIDSLKQAFTLLRN